MQGALNGMRLERFVAPSKKVIEGSKKYQQPDPPKPTEPKPGNPKPTKPPPKPKPTKPVPPPPSRAPG